MGYVKSFNKEHTINCAKQCVIQPTTERVIGQIYERLIRRDYVSLKFSQSNNYTDKGNNLIEINAINEQLCNLFKI